LFKNSFLLEFLFGNIIMVVNVVVSSLFGIGLKKITEQFDKSVNATPSEMQEAALRAEIQASVLLTQAKVEQELAISRRIDSAEEVEIEEYYDISGKGNLGVNIEGENIDLGLSAKGRKVTKRIIRFKGCTPIIQNPTNSSLDKENEEPNFVMK
jgi:hypothetical protein